MPCMAHDAAPCFKRDVNVCVCVSDNTELAYGWGFHVRTGFTSQNVAITKYSLSLANTYKMPTAPT